jgi:short-subunit dehydrogenase
VNKTALITGASAGLGAALAPHFATDGHDVVLVARRRDKLEALASELRDTCKIAAHVIVEDLAAPGATERIVAELGSRGVKVEFLVNNAGFGATGAFATQTLGRCLDMVHVNIVALMTLTRLLLPGMIARGSGRVLNIGSTAGFLPGPFMALYYASKAFVNSFTEALAVELRGTGVTATVSCPGATDTEFAQVAGSDDSPLFKSGVMDTREVAQEAYRAMMRGDVVAIPGFRNKFRMATLRLAPRSVARNIAAQLNATVPATPRT